VIDQAQKLRETFRNTSRMDFNALETTSVLPDSTPSSCTSIAVTSGKGGVGKTNVCLSLGIMLSLMKKKVLILDADLGLANIHILLGLAPDKTLHNYINKECSLYDIVMQGPAGIHIVPAASGLEAMANIEPVQLGLLLRELSQLERNYDFLLIDTGAGIGRTVTEFASMADRGILVATAEPTSLADAYAVTKVLYKKRIPALSVVVNMASSDKEGKETFDRLNALVVKFLNRPLELLGIIPFDKQVAVSVRKQVAMALSQPRSLFASRMQQCARHLCGASAVKKESFFTRIMVRSGMKPVLEGGK
jgi:flagellar biosynthesis protein FlhG